MISTLLQRHAAAIGLTLTLATGAAQAVLVPQVLGFEDLGVSVIGSPMPAGYADFSWGTQWFYMTNAVDLSKNYLVTSTINGNLIKRADGADFYFDGADFWSRRGLDANGSFYFVLYHNGVTVYDGTQAKKGRMRFTGTPTFMKAPYTGPIDAMAFSFRNRDYNHFAMDTFRVRIDVPAQ